jgi:hypothetical protein
MIMTGPGGLLLVVAHLFAVLMSFMGGVEKGQITKLGCLRASPPVLSM